ncbi:MAG TPA: Hpt domain-containing protein [Vicinamibacterales bacterium]|nr:Hpt domain-containing protein [Vicinamibacterales bacterium]
MDPAVLETLRQLNQDGEPDVLAEVLRLFLTDTPARLDAIGAAVASGDVLALQRAAHGLKGAAGAIGAWSLQAACRALEEIGKRNSLESSIPASEAVRREYDRVQTEIRHLL